VGAALAQATLVIWWCWLASTAYPLSAAGRRVPAALDEGDLLYMPSALPGLSAQRATELLQISNRMIKTVPEVERVFGKAGRAETATDPAPLEMFETTVKLKPREQWRPGMTPEKLVRSWTRR
jgi:Cu(I)/Ag(I) efflux system membrane protein CusA/SilA